MFATQSQIFHHYLVDSIVAVFANTFERNSIRASAVKQKQSRVLVESGATTLILAFGCTGSTLREHRGETR